MGRVFHALYAFTVRSNIPAAPTTAATGQLTEQPNASQMGSWAGLAGMAFLLIDLIDSRDWWSQRPAREHRRAGMGELVDDYVLCNQSLGQLFHFERLGQLPSCIAFGASLAQRRIRRPISPSLFNGGL